MRTTLIAVMLLASGSVFGADISIGINIGPPPPPYVVHVLPPRPDPDFVWVPGYWYPAKKHYKWHEGYWTRLPYEGAEWVPPHYDGERYFVGYWYGGRGRLEHNHRWDRERDRDCHWGHDRGRHRGHDRDDQQ
jgi:hypothetical protein